MENKAWVFTEDAWKKSETKIPMGHHFSHTKSGFYERNKYFIQFMNFLGMLPITQNNDGKANNYY